MQRGSYRAWHAIEISEAIEAISGALADHLLDASIPTPLD